MSLQIIKKLSKFNCQNIIVLI